MEGIVMYKYGRYLKLCANLEWTVFELSAIAKNPGWRGTPPAMSFYFAFYVSIIYGRRRGNWFLGCLIDLGLPNLSFDPPMSD